MCVVCVVAVWCSGCILGSRPEVVSSSPTLAIFHLVFHLPPNSPFSPPSCVIGYLTFAVCKFEAYSLEIAMVQVGLQVPTTLSVSKGLLPCEFLA